MRKKSLKRLLASSLLLIAIIVTSITAFAGNDSFPFRFYLKANQGITYSETRYRETTRNNNPWKIDFRNDTEEGSDNIAMFGLIKNNTSNWAYYPADCTEGHAPYYRGTNDYGDATNVNLAVANNNYTSNTFFVDGYWDEETGGTI